MEFSGTEFAGLLAQVAGGRFDVGSSNITTTDERRRLVGFTNGYDFGYFSLVVSDNSAVKGFSDLGPGKRIAVVQGTVQDEFVVNQLHLDPVKFPDYNTAYANLKSGQVDAWVAPSAQAEGAVKPGDGTSVAQNTFSLDNFVGWAVAKNNQPLIPTRSTAGSMRSSPTAPTRSFTATRCPGNCRRAGSRAPRRRRCRNCRTSRRSPPSGSRTTPRRPRRNPRSSN